MKKISLVLCFALLMVAMLALGVFAATNENIADDARIELHDSNKTYADEKALIDGDYSTACSAGDGPASWINYKFHYDADKFPKGVTVSSVRVIFDSTGTISNVGTYTELLNKNFTIHLRLYDINGNASYLNQKWNSINGDKNIIKAQYAEDGETVLYRYLEYVFAEPVSGVYQVEVPVENGKDKEIAVWEVEIYNYICPDEEHDWVGQLCGERCDFCGVYKNTELECVPEADDGDCRTAILCQYCDSVLVPSKKHVFAVGSTVCSNDGCVFEGKNITSTTTITPANHTGNAYTAGNGEYIMWWYNTAYIFDGNYSSAANSNYYGTYKFGFELKNPAKLSEIFIVSNASGYNAGTSFNNFNENLEITVTLYDAEGTAIKTTVYQSRNFEDPNVVPIYSANGSMTAVAYKLDTNYATAKKVEVVIKGGVFEVEIYQHVTCDYKHIETKAPTCTADGYELYACDCGESYTVKTGDKLGHSWNEGEVIKEATDLEEGELLQTCNTCGEPRTLAIPTTNHEHDYNTFVETKLAPTCAVPGKDIYVCRCGETAEVVTSATGEHAYTVFVDYTQAPTYLKDGAADYKCETCDATENRVVGRLIMNTAKYAIPTKTYGGWTVCVDYINDGNYNLGSAGTHGEYNGWSFDLDYGENYYFDKMTFVVNSVGKFPSDGAFNFETKTNNSYYFTVTLTDIEGNVVYSEQLNTGLSVEMTGIDANGQEFLYDIVIIEFPEALVASKMSVYCHTGNNNKLGMWEVESFGLPVNYHEDHTYTVLVNPITAATCTTDGLGLYRCNRCEETAEAAIPATGHTWVAATCVAPKTCTVCAATEGDATGVHNYATEIEKVPATKTEAGYIIYGCTTCEATYTETLPKLEATIYYVSNATDFKNAIDGNSPYVMVDGEKVLVQDGDIVRLDASIEGEIEITASIYVRKDIIIDFNGKTVRTKGSSGSLLMMMNGSLISSATEKGTLIHTGVNNVLRIYGHVTLIQNMRFVSDNEKADKAAGISVLSSTASGFGYGYVDTIRNVLIENAEGRNSLKVGIEAASKIKTDKPDLGVEHVIGVIDNATVVDASLQALWFQNSADCGVVKNSTLGGTRGVLFAGNNSVEFENCDINATKAAFEMADNATVSITADSATVEKLSATEGPLFVTGSGVTANTFSIAGYTFADGKVVCDNHNYVAVVVDPTCEADGYTRHTCSGCGAYYDDATTPVVAHTYVCVDGDCTCSVCGNTFEHNYEYADGAFTCTNCGDSYTCEHNWEVVESANATCTTAGYTEYECSNCDETKTEVGAAALGHKYNHKTGACDNNCDNLVIKEVANWTDLRNEVNDKDTVDFDVIKLTANIDDTKSQFIYIDAPIVVDLGGCTVTTNSVAPFFFRNGECSLVNGKINKTNNGYQMLQAKSQGVKLLADLVLTSTSSGNVTGFLTYGNVGKMENVTIIGARNNGIEIQSGGVIAEMNKVNVSADGQAINIVDGAITKATECTFTSKNVGIVAQSLKGSIALNKCTINADGIALVIQNVYNNADFSYDSATKFITKGAIYDIGSNNIASLKNVVALVNGSLYADLDAAIAALLASTEEVTEFTLMKDLVITETIVIENKVNFGFGGASYSVPVAGTNVVISGTVAGYNVTSSVDVPFRVAEGGVLSISGTGKFTGTESSIAIEGGQLVVISGTYVGFNPLAYILETSCPVSANDGTYVIAPAHDYDDEALEDKTTFGVDGVCNNCGYVRGIFAVYNVYYGTIEEALAAALETGKDIVLAADIVIDEATVWDLTGTVFNFNSLTITSNGNLSIVGGTFTQDVTENLADGYCVVVNNKNQYVVTAHNVVAIGEAKAPTCTDDGITAGSKCTLCGTVLEEQTVIPATGHTAGEAVVEKNVAPSCTTAGSYDSVVYCTVCDAEISRTPVTVDALGHKYIAGAPAEDGSVTYTCENGCGASYVVNNSKISGTYYIESMDMFNATFNNGTLTIVDNVMGMSGTYAYEYVVGTYTVTVIDESFSFVLDKGGNVAALTLATGRQHGLAKYVPAVDAVLGTNTTIAGDIKFVFTAAEDGKYTITANGMKIIIEGIYGADVYNDSFEANLVAGVPFEFYISSNAEAQFEIALVPSHVCSYVETSRTDSTCTTAGSVTYTCSCGESYTETLKLAPHTEVKIPAVPSYKKDGTYYYGKTSGMECSVCETITKQPKDVEADVVFSMGTSLSLSEDISIIYKPNIPANLDATNAYMVFTFLGENYEYNDFTIDPKNGRNVYKFVEVKPQLMAENVKAIVYAADSEGYEYAYEVSNYSVMTYCVNQFTKSSNAKLKTLLSDILVYGAESQKYVGYKTNQLVTDLAGIALTPSTFETVDPSYKIAHVEREGKDLSLVDWKAANLTLGNEVRIKLHFEAYGSLEGVTIRVTIAGETTEYTDLEKLEKSEKGRYMLPIAGLKVAGYDLPITAKFYKDGKEIGSVYTHSIYSYICSNYSKTSSSQALIKALFNYAESAAAYTN